MGDGKTEVVTLRTYARRRAQRMGVGTVPRAFAILDAILDALEMVRPEMHVLHVDGEGRLVGYGEDTPGPRPSEPRPSEPRPSEPRPSEPQPSEPQPECPPTPLDAVDAGQPQAYAVAALKYGGHYHTVGVHDTLALARVVCASLNAEHDRTNYAQIKVVRYYVLGVYT